MSTQCYAMVRGSVVRVTKLNNRGALDDSAIQRVVSKSVAKVSFDPITDSSKTELVRTDDEQGRLIVRGTDQTIRFSCGIDFVQTDPSLINLLTGAPLVRNAAGEAVGFDASTRLPVASFALEIWSKLAGVSCRAGARQWGYTLVPFLRGGHVKSVSFGDGMANFSVVGASTRRSSKWAVGPYDIIGPWQRLATPVSRNLSWRNMVTTWQPPAPTNGIETFADILNGGTAGSTSQDVIDSGSATASGSAWIINGGTP